MAIDGSRSSQHAGRWAAQLARLGHARVAVLHVSPPRGALPAATANGKDATALQRVVESTLDELHDVDIRAERLVAQGEPRAEVVRAAILGRADIVCLGARGRTGARRVALGGVSDAVKERAPSSVLVARGPPPAKRVLAATDGSPESRRALALALQLAEGWAVPLDVLHVVEGDIADAQLPLATPDADVDPLLRSSAEVHSLLASGDAAEQIVAMAKERGANLIVLGCRGAGGETKTAPGHVAARVLREASVSVLMVKAPQG